MKDEILSILNAGPMIGMTAAQVRDKTSGDHPAGKVHSYIERMVADGTLNAHVDDTGRYPRRYLRISQGGERASSSVPAIGSLSRSE